MLNLPIEVEFYAKIDNDFIKVTIEQKRLAPISKKKREKLKISTILQDIQKDFLTAS